MTKTRRSRRQPLQTRAKLAILGVATAFGLAVVAAAGTSFWEFVTGGLVAEATSAPSITAAGSASPSHSFVASPGMIVSSPAAPSTSTPAPSLAATEVRLVRPFTLEGLRVGYSVVDVGVGDCQASNLSNDPESLRCFAASQIFDPCWTGADFSEAACLRDPWNRDIVTLTVEQLDSSPNAETNALPWAIELALEPDERDPVRCVFVGGAVATVAGERVNYGCERAGEDAGDVIGEPDRSSERPWRVYYSAPATSEVVQVEVKTLWR